MPLDFAVLKLQDKVPRAVHNRIHRLHPVTVMPVLWCIPCFITSIYRGAGLPKPSNPTMCILSTYRGKGCDVRVGHRAFCKQITCRHVIAYEPRSLLCILIRDVWWLFGHRRQRLLLKPWTAIAGRHDKAEQNTSGELGLL